MPACLGALGGQEYRDFRVYVVDNGSGDGSVGMLGELEGGRSAGWFGGELPAVTRVIYNGSNLGFAEANNQAIGVALGEGCSYIATLNNDAVAEPGWLGEMVEAIEGADRRVGMVASTMLFAHRPERVASAGIRVHRDGVALECGVGTQADELERRGVRAVFGPSAGAALYKAELLRDVGLFDARFFSYLEDADLAWRARGRGWRGVYAPRARVLHEYSATGGQGSAFKNRLVARNREWLLYKNMPAPLVMRYAGEIARYDLAAVVAGLATGNREALGGRVEALRELGRFTTSRRMNIASARLHPDEIEGLLAPAMSPGGYGRYRRRLARLLG